MEKLKTTQMMFTEAGHLRIVNAYAKRIKLVETIDGMVDTQMALSPGMAVLGMVLNTLSGRTPLYRLMSCRSAGAMAFHRALDVV